MVWARHGHARAAAAPSATCAWVRMLYLLCPDQQAPPARTRKKDSMSASVPVSPSPLKSAEAQVGQQVPARQAKKVWMSRSVPVSPSLLKSALQAMVRVAGALVSWPQGLETRTSYESASACWVWRMVRVSVLEPEIRALSWSARPLRRHW